MAWALSLTESLATLISRDTLPARGRSGAPRDWVPPRARLGVLRVDFNLDAIGQAFWHHFSHLRVVDVDDYGISVRSLSPQTCRACARLWDTLTPVKVHGREVFPASRAERYNVFQRQAFTRTDYGMIPVMATGHELDEPLSVQRVRRFTDWQARRPLDRY